MIITVFRSRLDQDSTSEYGPMAAQMVELATAMPGFVSVKGFVADDGERCTIVEFDSWQHHDAWASHPEHRMAQQRGRDTFYTTYDLKVAEVERHLSFAADTEGETSK